MTMHAHIVLKFFSAFLRFLGTFGRIQIVPYLIALVQIENRIRPGVVPVVGKIPEREQEFFVVHRRIKFSVPFHMQAAEYRIFAPEFPNLGKRVKRAENMYSGKQFFKQIKIVFIFFVVFLNCDILAEDIGMYRQICIDSPVLVYQIFNDTSNTIIRFPVSGKPGYQMNRHGSPQNFCRKKPHKSDITSKNENLDGQPSLKQNKTIGKR